MPKHLRRNDRIRVATLLAGLVLPTLTLVPFGSFWLWQNGYLLYWAVAAMICVASAVYFQRRILPEPTIKQPRDLSEDHSDPSWSPAEMEAWQAVEAIAASADIDKLNSRDAVIELGVQTISAVAARLHPAVKDPLWQFTLPEAFALTERVSRRLRRFTVQNIPLSDRLTVSNALAVYRWRGTLDLAEKAFDVWRLARLVNPVTAATHELRERLSKQILEAGRAHVADRLVETYVKEVGRAAIDLYGGRLRVDPEALEQEISSASRTDTEAIALRSEEPLRLLVCGQQGAGKSSLVNALAGEVHAAVDALPVDTGFVPYRLHKSGFPTTLVIDSPGLDGKSETLSGVIEQAKDCDLILCVVPANRADREIEHRLLAHAKAAFAAMPRRRPPEVVVALTHIDRLRPFQEWAPPYDFKAAATPKATAMKSALEATAIDLSLNPDDIVPVSLRPNAEYNVEALWDRIAAKLPEAQRTKLVRQLVEARSGWNFRNIWSQTLGAGRLIGKTFKQ